MKPERQTYRDHRIEVRMPEVTRDGERHAEPTEEQPKPDLLIDDTPIPYGQLPDGSYYLQDYAYEWRRDLMDLARGYLDHRADAAEIVADRKRREGG